MVPERWNRVTKRHPCRSSVAIKLRAWARSKDEKAPAGGKTPMEMDVDNLLLSRRPDFSPSPSSISHRTDKTINVTNRRG